MSVSGEFGRYVYLTFKLRRMVPVSIVVLSIILGALIFFLPSEVRLAYAYIFTFLTVVMLSSATRFITGSVVTLISTAFYNRKHKLEEHSYPEAKQMATKMGMEYDKPIYVTDNLVLRNHAY